MLYGPRAKRWAMTERGARSLSRDATSFAVGPSALHWDQGRLVIRIDEIGVPLPLRLRGEVRLTPHVLPEFAINLDGAERHHWRPIAPSAAVEVVMEQPALRWRGTGYLDSNWGDEPLEKGFIAWDWSRAHGDGTTAILYHGEKRDRDTFGFAIACDAAGRFHHIEAPQRVALPATLWRIGRATRADNPFDARVLRTYEDTPFYARSLMETQLLGRRMIAMHESLSLDRFANPLVQLMLPFRMPRRSS
ncbi:carotenoid 1,2-hydratase [Dongia mobilis]|uniref:carotenoid 1,2-hydratase n=1 Tax=Dongia mobilis TaxID=578943 RepID=UPI001FB7CEDC|nr:carotenoid 1,2-hydratase [Dongia mobilis]